MTSTYASNIHPGDISPALSLAPSSALSEPNQPWFIRINRRCHRLLTRRKRRAAEQVRRDAWKVQIATMEEARRRDLELEGQRKSGKTVDEWRKMNAVINVEIDEGELGVNGGGPCDGDEKEP